jgi:hypothetical protein
MRVSVSAGLRLYKNAFFTTMPRVMVFLITLVFSLGMFAHAFLFNPLNSQPTVSRIYGLLNTNSKAWLSNPYIRPDAVIHAAGILAAASTHRMQTSETTSQTQVVPSANIVERPKPTVSRILDNAVNLSGVNVAKSVGVKNGVIILGGGGKASIKVSKKMVVASKQPTNVVSNTNTLLNNTKHNVIYDTYGHLSLINDIGVNSILRELINKNKTTDWISTPTVALLLFGAINIAAILKEAYMLRRRNLRFNLPSISFELRSALDTIIGFSYLIYSGKVGKILPAQKEFLFKVLMQSNTLKSDFQKFIIEVNRVGGIDSDLLRTFSFKLRDSLNSIVGFTNLMYLCDEKSMPERQKKFLHSILTESNQLISLLPKNV